MTNMNSDLHSIPRRLRLGVAIASLVAIAGVLAGCSAEGDYAAEAGNEPAAGEDADAGGDALYSDASAQDGTETATEHRDLIVTGAMYMTVTDPIAAADQAASIVKAAEGRIDARSEQAPDEGYGGAASLTMRIPNDELDAVVDDLRKLGQVDEYTTNATDVTNQVTDLEAHISTLKASTERIAALLEEAQGISDIITLENELAMRQAELESLEAQQRGLEDSVAMSTIDLSLTTEPVVIVEVDDTPDSFWDGLVSGWNALAGFVAGLLVILGVLLPWLVVFALITLAVLLVVRSTKARNARRAVAPSAAPPAAPPIQPAAEPAVEPTATK